jgi:hypothetical protein
MTDNQQSTQQPDQQSTQQPDQQLNKPKRKGNKMPIWQWILIVLGIIGVTVAILFMDKMWERMSNR